MILLKGLRRTHILGIPPIDEIIVGAWRRIF